MRATGWLSPSQLDVAWVALAAGCLAVMVAWPSWETIPFHVIWISLTLLYGFRVWSIAKTSFVLAGVAVATGASIMVDAFARRCSSRRSDCSTTSRMSSGRP